MAFRSSYKFSICHGASSLGLAAGWVASPREGRGSVFVTRDETTLWTVWHDGRNLFPKNRFSRREDAATAGLRKLQDASFTPYVAPV